METRPLGRTGQESSVLTFGAIVLNWLTQEGANQAVELALAHDINHVDVAPEYGDAEIKLGPKLREHREEIFLGCKTGKRTYEGAREELDQSLDRMGIDHIDLYQFHGLERAAELETITGENGALRAFCEAKEEGIVDHIGLTSHGHPELILDAIDRIDDLATVMFPMNYTIAAKDDVDHDYEAVLSRLEQEDIGAIGIKAFAKGSWPPEETLPESRRPYATWYQPYDSAAELGACLDFALSQGLTTLTNAGDPKLLTAIIDAAEGFEQLSEAEQNALIERGRSQESPVPAQLD